MATILDALKLGPLVFVLTSCGGPFARSGQTSINNIVHCQAGETVKACVEQLPSNTTASGTVLFDIGVYPSGYSGGTDRITQAGVTLLGAKMPEYNHELTALTGGTIITGTLPVGANNFTARDLGIDVGPTIVGSVPADGFAMWNIGQVMGEAPFKSPFLENIAVLGINAPGTHSILVENVTDAYLHNLRCRFETHCFAFKGDGVIDTVDAAGGSTDDIVLESDFYAPSQNISLSHVTLGSVIPGDSGGLALEAKNANLQHITISDVTGQNIRYGLHVDAADGFVASDLNASKLNFNNSGYQDQGTSCLAESGRSGTAQTISNLHISEVSCSYFGQVQNINDQVINNGVISTVEGSNILADAFWLSGTWQLSNISLDTVHGNGIVSLGGVTTVVAPSFTNITGSPLVEMGGQIISEP